MSSEILMILQARAIPEAIESLNSLEIEKVWFRGYTEVELETHLNRFIEQTDYDVYWIIADDVVVSEKPLEVLRPLLSESDVVSGYCRLFESTDRVNLSLSPIRAGHIKSHAGLGGMFRHYKKMEEMQKTHEFVGGFSSPYVGISMDDDDVSAWVNLGTFEEDMGGFMTIQEVERFDKPFRSYFAGWSFTGMKREVWLNYPFQTGIHGSATDAQFAFRYVHKDDGVILTHRDAHHIHLKAEDTTHVQNWIVGVDEPIIHFGEGVSEVSKIPETSVWFKGRGDDDER